MIFCVHCGAPEQNEKAYCKRCGKWLGQSPPEQRMVVTLVFSAVSAVFGAASAIELYSTYLGTKAGTPAVYLAATFCCVISVHQTVSFFFQLELFKRLKKGRSAERPEEAPGHSGIEQVDQHAPESRTVPALGAADTARF